MGVNLVPKYNRLANSKVHLITFRTFNFLKQQISQTIKLMEWNKEIHVNDCFDDKPYSYEGIFLLETGYEMGNS